MSDLHANARAGGGTEPSGARLARSLLVARQVGGLTQQQLAAASTVSRATIAQIESGGGDPRLSTVGELARALGVPTMALLMGSTEVGVLAQLPEEARDKPFPVLPADVALMRSYLGSGLSRDRGRAVRVAARAARSGGEAVAAAAVLAAVFSTISPGRGTAVGALMGRLWGMARPGPAERPHSESP